MTPKQKIDAAKAEAAGFRHKKNIYTCEQCFGHIVTVDRDEGVTPFMIQCQATVGCKGHMQSSLYRVFDQRMRASHEWYRPNAAENVSPILRDHVANGGLLLREALP